MMFEERSTKQSGTMSKLPEPVRYSPPRAPPPPPPPSRKDDVSNGYNGRKTPRDDADDRNDRDDRREGKRSRDQSKERPNGRDPSKERTSRVPSRNEEEPKRRSRTPSRERAPSPITRAEDIADSDFDPRRPRYMEDRDAPHRAVQPPTYNKDRNYPRDPKDYLIGGIYGPQPKTKPTEASNGRNTATRRSRSYPRASSKDDDDDDDEYDDSANVRKQNGAARANQDWRRDAAAGRYGNNGGARAFSLIDLKTGEDGKSPTGAGAKQGGAAARGRRGALSDPERPVDRRSRSDDEAVPGRKNQNRSQRRKQDNRPAWANPSVPQEQPETYHIGSKARLVTFFKNGDLFFPGVKVSLRPGKDFGTLEALYTYLTQRTDLPNGVRYVFGFDGRRVRRLDELEDGGSYVCSSRKKFQRMPYGSSRNDWKPHSKFESRADLKLFRDPSTAVAGNLGSPGPKTVVGAGMAPGAGGGKAERKSPETQGQQGSKEGRVIRVINAQDPSIQSRIILNLRTTQPWENVLDDLGEALRMPGAKKLFTTSGHEVQSFSQLRNDYRDVDTFYLSNANSKPRPTDDDFYLYNNVAKPTRGGANNNDQPRRGRAQRPNAPGRPGSAPPSARARELESERTGATRGRDRDRGRSRNSNNARNNGYPVAPKSISPMREADGLLDPVRVKVNGQRRELYAPLQHKMIRDESPPDKTMQLNWVYPYQSYGYRGFDSRQNLAVLPSGELVYFVAAVAVVFDRFRGRQRHYIGHSEDIQCLTIHPSNELCATGQKEGRGRIGLAQVHVWDLETMTTQVVIGLNDAENGIATLAFSNRNGGQHLMVVDDSDEHVLAVWSWRSRRLIARTIVNRSKVTGGRFIPKDDMQVVTFGESHLTVWTRQKDSTFDRDDLIGEEDGKVITCLEFDEDGTRMMVGDTDGNVTVWSDERSGAYQHYRVFQAQMRAVSCLLLLYDGTLLSAGGSERDRFIKAWDSNHNYRPLMSNRLPESAGGIRSMCPQKLDASDNNIYVGTSKNVIVEGSVNRRFKIVVQGHHKELAALAVDPDEAAFVTAGHDRCISRWVMHKLVWRVQVENECLALSVHPAGDVVAVGTADGHIIILTLPRGMHVATLPASKHAITCMSYNPDGTMLGCGLEEGSLVLYHSSNRGFSYRKSKLLKGLGDALVQMDWSRDSKSIQTVSTDYEQILWDITVMEIEKIPSTMRDATWQGITCTLTYSVHGIWNNRNQTVDATHTTCCSSASGKLLAAGDNEGYIRLFRYPCISPRADFYEVKGQSSPVQCVRFLYDDSFLITVGGYDGTLMQWMMVSAN